MGTYVPDIICLTCGSVMEQVADCDKIIHVCTNCGNAVSSMETKQLLPKEILPEEIEILSCAENLTFGYYKK